MNIKSPLDTYAIRAQLSPALLSILPLGIGLVAWTGEEVVLEPAIATVLATCGATFAMSVVARNRGREQQISLWKNWGGSPTTQLLRHRGRGNPVLRERWHKSLAALLGQRFPSAQEEVSDPEAADNLYEAATRRLIEKQKQFPTDPLIKRENTNYGFCRNLLGLKPMGLATGCIGVVSSAAAIFYGPGQSIVAVTATGINILFLLAWLIIIKPSWVLQPAFAYAERLLESAEAPEQKCSSRLN